MPTLHQNLNLERCPHCAVAHPNLHRDHVYSTTDHTGQNSRRWGIYSCKRCGGVVTATAPNDGQEITTYFPSTPTAKDDIPERPREYLKEAMESLHAPAGAVMLAASAVDAMLKTKGFQEGSLHARIEQAAAEHIITADMAKWAHDVRLDANDQRHADNAASLPSSDDATRVIDFASALGEILYVLPNRVQRGLRS